MLEIHQKNDNIGYEEKLEKINVEYPIILESFTDGKIDGYCIYSIENDALYVYEISYGKDIMLCDGLVRTALFKASMIGIDKAEFPIADENIKWLHLCDEDWKLSSIKSVMDGCKSCRKEK